MTFDGYDEACGKDEPGLDQDLSGSRHQVKTETASGNKGQAGAWTHRISAVKGKVFWAFIGVVVGFALAFVLGYSIFDIGRNYNPDANQLTPSIDLMVLQEKIEKNNELATATFMYTNAENFEGQPAVFDLFDIPYITGKDFVLKYDGIIKAGVDLSDVVIEPAGEGTVIVTLPKPYIISHELDEESFETLREHETLFGSIKIEDIQGFRSEQKGLMEQRAYERGVLDEALENAKQNLRSMLEAALPEGTVIEFKEAE